MASALTNSFDLNVGRTVAQQEWPVFPFDQMGVSIFSAKTTFDIKQVWAKGINHACKWALVIEPEHGHSHHIRNAAEASRDVKNFIGMTEIPGNVHKALVGLSGFATDPSLGNARKAFIDTLGIVNPTVDAIEFGQARNIIYLEPETMTTLSQVSAGALFISMFDLAIKNLTTIVDAAYVSLFQGPIAGEQAQELANRQNEAWTILWLKMLDLAKAVSYIAMSSLILVGAFYATIPNAALWILTASTSALFFTIMGEFAKRAYDPNGLLQVNFGPIPTDTAATAAV